MRRILIAAAIAVAVAPAARGSVLEDARKITPRQLSVEVERLELANGLVVLLAPDPSVSSVAVWMSFRAGSIYEPPGKSGLAHLAEHVMASGPTPDTNYAAILEERRARHFNASTGFDAMTFEAIVPSEELPAALWVAADRLGALPALVDGAVVERHRRVVQQERAVRNVDAPYGLVDEHLFRRLYAAPHPLRGGVIGVPSELATVGAEDVRRFVSDLLVPANAVLVVAGAFDPAEARRLVADGFGRLPGGHRARPPATPPPPPALVDLKEEPLSRRPRVTLAWRFPRIAHEDAVALQLGAQLLSYMTDGAWGMEIAAGVEEYAGESLFTMELTVPYDEPMRVVHDDADGFLRMLTHKEMPLDFMIAANLALDRAAMFRLDALGGRAAALARFELLASAGRQLGDHLAWHWQLDGSVLRDTARTYLRGAKVVLHARPTRPKPARAERL
jgi:zinc protease